ncbi:MAG: hypothetical protein MJZ35_06460 [Bacteroidaceae bacterium]|nr:hypothetical protein [Bacteroidaceae bacterium]
MKTNIINMQNEELIEYIDLLPFMYARYEVIRDEQGFIRDSRCIGANKIFREYYKIENPVGVLRSAFLTQSNPFWNFHATQCLLSHEIETWEYNGTYLGELNVIMRRVNNQTIDVYTINMDKDRQIEKRRRMEYQEILKAKYLCKVKIWHWDLSDNKLYSKDTLYGEESIVKGFDEDRGFIVWSADDIFKNIIDPTEKANFDTAVENLMYKKTEREDLYVHIHINGEVKHVILMMMIEEFDDNQQPISIIGCTRIASYK